MLVSLAFETRVGLSNPILFESGTSHIKRIAAAISPMSVTRGDRSGAMIRVTGQDRGGAVELFDDDQAHEHVREGQWAE